MYRCRDNAYRIFWECGADRWVEQMEKTLSELSEERARNL
jgi:hypothetical protein